MGNRERNCELWDEQGKSGSRGGAGTRGRGDGQELLTRLRVTAGGDGAVPDPPSTSLCLTRQGRIPETRRWDQGTAPKDAEFSFFKKNFFSFSP